MAEVKEAKKPDTAVAKANTGTIKKAPQTMKDYVAIMEPEIKKALPSMIKPERFMRMINSALSTNPKLAQCTPASFLGAMMTSAQCGLEPNTVTQEAFIIPYNDHGTLKAQFQLGAQGRVRLAQRDHTTVDAKVVYKNDEFEYEFGLNPKLRHVPALKDRGEPIAYYAVWRNKEYGEDTFGFEVMSKEDIEKHAKRFSKAYSSGPWRDHFDAMAKKTVIIQALKYAPLSVETRELQSNDGTIKSSIGVNMADIPSDVDVDIEYAEVIEDADTGEVTND